MPVSTATRTVPSGWIVGATGVDMPVIPSSWEWSDLPAKQIAVKRLGAFGVVGWNFKPNDACCLFLL
jgi:hypothetical protein